MLKRVFSWSVENQLLAANPAERIRVRGVKKQRLRDPEFTDVEANIILRATLEDHSPNYTPQRRLAHRWAPWLCAYTGARIGEIAQLRRDDILLVEGVWAIRITPEAGSVKNNEARLVALHPHLLDQGFVEAIYGLSGPLFFDPTLSKGGSSANRQSDKVGQRLCEWVRTLGVTDRGVQPNHAWRHRFITLARRHSIPEEVRDKIIAHADGDVGASYGSIPIDVIAREISKLPWYEV